ncbi:MAG: hypothetical protein ACK6DC_17185 [Planctomycetota bacterium]
MKQHLKGRPRPPYLRALGRFEPPAELEADGSPYALLEIFKHDSWAATAVYARSKENGESGSFGKRIVCKFNRQASIGFLPMRWLGRVLARRETKFLTTLQSVPGIPAVCREVRLDGVRATHVSAHEFIEGKPLSITCNMSGKFFEQLDQLLQDLHTRRIAYVDLHKQENVLVGDDGRPYLIDFQISLRIPNFRWLNPLLRVLCECDRYHVAKHRSSHHVADAPLVRPWIIRMHRTIAVPFRTLRRRFLVWLGVRKGDGHASSEIAPEVGLR